MWGHGLDWTRGVAWGCCPMLAVLVWCVYGLARGGFFFSRARAGVWGCASMLLSGTCCCIAGL